MYVIATTTELPSPSSGTRQPATSDPQFVGRYCVVRYTNQLEPVQSFLGRYLKRRLVSIEADGVSAAGLELVRVVEWLPKVWQKLNWFLAELSPPGVDITIGR